MQPTVSLPQLTAGIVSFYQGRHHHFSTRSNSIFMLQKLFSHRGRHCFLHASGSEVFDPRYFQRTRYRTLRTGTHSGHVLSNKIPQSCFEFLKCTTQPISPYRLELWSRLRIRYAGGCFRALFLLQSVLALKLGCGQRAARCTISDLEAVPRRVLFFEFRLLSRLSAPPGSRLEEQPTLVLHVRGFHDFKA